MGHLFQGRFKAILIDGDTYLLDSSRYVVLNPVRAAMVKAPADWPLSNYRASVGLEPPQSWLAVDGLLVHCAEQRGLAQTCYAKFVAEGSKAESQEIEQAAQDRNAAL